MRYNVLTSRMFRNRITRYLGVLVGAALLVALGLPGVAQAQAPAMPKIMHDGTSKIIVTWNDVASVLMANGNDADAMAAEKADTTADSYLVELTLDGKAIPAVDQVKPRMPNGGMLTTSPEQNNSHGVWQARVTYYDDDTPPASAGGADAPMGDMKVNSVDKKLGTPSGWVTYTHGPPSAPENFVSVGQDTAALRVLAWTAAMVDTGIMHYEMRWTDGDPLSTTTEWTKWGEEKSPASIDELEMGQQYTFELRGVGTSSNNSADKVGSGVPGEVATLKVPEMMPPVTVPTLPEIAALLLAMLLLGSGAYLLRGRQLGGLPAA